MNYEPKAVSVADWPVRYKELCDLRDAVNAQVAPVQERLDKAIEISEQARVVCNTLAAEIDDLRGREQWIALKKEIGQLAKALSGRGPG